MKIMAKHDKSYEDGLMQSLINPEEAAAYLKSALELKDQKVIFIVLKHIARAHGIEF